MGADCQLLRIIGNGKVKGNIVLEQRGGNADEEPLGANARRAKVSLTISTIIRTIGPFETGLIKLTYVGCAERWIKIFLFTIIRLFKDA